MPEKNPFEEEQEQEVKEAEVVESEDSASEDNQSVEKSNQPVEKKKSKIDQILDTMDEELEKQVGVSTGQFGDSFSRYPIPRAKFNEGVKERIAVLTTSVVFVKLHYHEETGYFFCFEARCCDILGLPTTRAVIPIIRYDSDKRGKPVSKEFTVEVLRVGQSVYDNLMTIHDLRQDEGGSITEADILVTCNDEQYQDITFNVAGKALWRRDKGMAKEVINYWKDNKKHLTEGLGRRLNEEDMLIALGYDGGQQAPPQQAPGDVNFEDEFN